MFETKSSLTFPLVPFLHKCECELLGLMDGHNTTSPTQIPPGLVASLASQISKLETVSK